MANRLLIALWSLIMSVPGPASHADTERQQAPEPDDCNPSRVESIACGTYFFDVAGKVVFTLPDGSQLPVRGARFFDADDPAHPTDAEPRDMKVKSSRLGEFRFKAFVWESSRTKPCPDGTVQTHEVYVPSYYLLRARGCEDLTVRVEQDWNPGTIVMNCPGRT